MRIDRRVPLAIAVVCLGGASGFFVARLARNPVDGLVTTPRPAPSSMIAAPGPASAAPGSANSPAGGVNDAGGSANRGARKIPANVPDFSLADAQGIRHSISEWKGRPLLINFWATWCTPCRREIPLLKALRRERSTDGVEVVGIAVDFRDAVQRYAREMGIDYPVLVGEQDGLDAIAAFGMDTVFPFTVFADAQGRIVTLKIGEMHADEARLILDQVRGIDQGRVELATARKAIADGVASLAAARARDAQAAAGSLPIAPVPGKSDQEVP